MIKSELIKQINEKEEKINALIYHLLHGLKNDDPVDVIDIVKRLRAMM